MILSLIFLLIQISTLRMDVLDNHAKNSTRNQEENATSLTRYLISQAQNEEEKAYVIYSWIAHHIKYDVRALRRGIRSNKDEAVLQKRIAVCEGYATLFDIMARKVGLNSKIIEGRARGTNNKDSYKGHAWNAVLINSSWFLLDATWGSGFIDSESDQFTASFNRFYFFTDPERLVVSHLPDDSKWQLLEKTISESDAKSLIKGSAEYYTWNIKPLTHLSAQIVTNGLERIALKIPNDVYITCELLDENEKPIKEIRTIVIRKDEEVEIWVSAPKKGVYSVFIYGKKNRNNENYPFLFSYELKSLNASKVIFPKTYESYTIQPFNLISPNPQSLIAKDSVLFDMESSAYQKMMIISGDNQISLNKEGQRFFQKLSPQKGKLLVVGSIKGDLNFEVLMEFVVR